MMSELIFVYTSYWLTEIGRFKKISSTEDEKERDSNWVEVSVCFDVISTRYLFPLSLSLYFWHSFVGRLCQKLDALRRAVIMPLGLVTIYNLQGHGAPRYTSDS